MWTYGFIYTHIQIQVYKFMHTFVYFVPSTERVPKATSTAGVKILLSDYYSPLKEMLLGERADSRIRAGKEQE